MMGSSCFLLLLVLSTSFPQLFHRAVVFVNADSNLIKKTCKSTKYYDLCVSSLKSDARSKKADTKGLAVIMVRIGMANATATNSYLSSKVLNTTDDKLRKVVQDCANKYSYASDALQTSLQDLAAESYDYAYMHVMAAADYPNACHNVFKSTPGLAYPTELGLREDGLKHICDVVLGIIDTLGW